MNWLPFAITAYVFYALQASLGPAWSVGGATPNLLLILAVFVGVSATRAVVPWALLVVGVLLDTLPGPLRDQGVIVGPQAVGFLVGAYAVLQLRNLLFRESVLTVVLLVLAVGGFAALVETLLITLRGVPWLADQPAGWGAIDQLGKRLPELLYTAAAAVPVGLLLGVTRPLWGFAKKAKAERVF
ncbi:MAG: hypothetical protein AAF800_05415 [Planctomycetota bacterium]